MVCGPAGRIKTMCVSLVRFFGFSLAWAACSSGVDAENRFPDSQVTALVTAACRGDTAEVKRLVAAGVDPNSKGNDEASPLSVAIGCRDLGGVSALVDVGADVNAVVERDTLPLIIAIHQGGPDMFRLLVERGADVYKYAPATERNSVGEAFLYGFETGDWSNLDYLMKRGIDADRFIDLRQADDIATFAARMRRYDKSIAAVELGYNRDLKTLLALAETDKGPKTERVTRDRARLIDLIRAKKERD